MQPRGTIKPRSASPPAPTGPYRLAPIDESAKAHKSDGVFFDSSLASASEAARVRVEQGPAVSLDEWEMRIGNDGPPIPAFWVKGQLLNVRNNGAEYVVTLLGEEFDPRHPERALRFPNPDRCQDFVSRWYQREHADPRAW